MSDLRYALFLGCTVPVRGFGYELSARKVAEKLGMKLIDIPESSCCGFPLESIHHHSALVLAARNLALAEAAGVPLLTLCSACTGHLTKVAKLFTGKEDAKILRHVTADLHELGYDYKGTTIVKHFARALLEDVGVEKLKTAVSQPLHGVNIAPHYGCHYMKPSDIFNGFDNPFHPESLDKLIEITGANSVNYKEKLQCCGGGILAIDEETPVKMVKQKLDHVKQAGADAMTLICPFCSIMYDEFQSTIESRFNTTYNTPVLYYPQLLGLAMGLDPKKDLAVHKNQVKVAPLLEKIAMGKSRGGR